MVSQIRRQIVFVALLTLTVRPASSSARQANPQGAVLQGVVKHARTGEPVPGAQVVLSDGNAAVNATRLPVPLVDTTSNNRGEFVFQNLAAGVFRVVVMSGGYVRRDSDRITVTAGQTINDLVLPLTPTGNVSGRVSSLTGEPLAGVTVSLQRRVYNSDGTPTLSATFSTRTNDLGEYRMYWVNPGRYYVSAVSSDGGLFRIGDDRDIFAEGVRRGDNHVREIFSLVYFPGVPEASQARAIDLNEGADLRGIDFNLARQSQQLYSLRGRVIDPITGRPPAQATLTLSGNGGSRNFPADPSTGSFEFRNLSPGRYTLSAGPESFLANAISGVGTRWGAVPVTIKDSNIEDFVHRIEVQPVSKGQVKVEGQLPPGTALQQLRVRLDPQRSDTGVAGLPANAVSADGSFSWSAEPEGEFRVRVSGLPPSVYVKEARLDNADVLNSFSRFSKAGNLQIVISANGGIVEGRVVDTQMRPIPSVEVVLVPDKVRSSTELFKKAVTDREGKFSIPGIAPGDYKLFSWESLEANSYFDADVLSQYEPKGLRVQVAESARQTVDVVLIPAEVSQR